MLRKLLGLNNSSNVNLTLNAVNKNLLQKLTICVVMEEITGHHACLSRSSYSIHSHIPILSDFPLIFHSIPDEIPEASRSLITRLYQLWLVLLITLLINMVACIVILITGEGDGARDLGASIGYSIPFS